MAWFILGYVCYSVLYGALGALAGGLVYRGAVLRIGQRVRLRQAWHGE